MIQHSIWVRLLCRDGKKIAKSNWDITAVWCFINEGRFFILAVSKVAKDHWKKSKWLVLLWDVQNTREKLSCRSVVLRLRPAIPGRTLSSELPIKCPSKTVCHLLTGWEKYQTALKRRHLTDFSFPMDFLGYLQHITTPFTVCTPGLFSTVLVLGATGLLFPSCAERWVVKSLCFSGGLKLAAHSARLKSAFPSGWNRCQPCCKGTSPCNFLVPLPPWHSGCIQESFTQQGSLVPTAVCVLGAAPLLDSSDAGL